MKKTGILSVVFIFSVFCCPICLFAQSNSSNADLNKNQQQQMKDFQAQYGSEKEDLELQLKKLQKDRDIAIRDNNKSLVDRRNQEIKQTQKKLSDLPKEYNSKFTDILTDEQKEANVRDDFYAKELAAEQAKMAAAEKKEAVKPVPPKQKKPAVKKKAPPKKPVPVEEEI
jgi:Membrane-bound metallopeptidase